MLRFIGLLTELISRSDDTNQQETEVVTAEAAAERVESRETCQSLVLYRRTGPVLKT